MNIILITLGAFWSIGCIGAPLWVAAKCLFGDRYGREIGMGLLALFLGLPIGTFLAILPWAFAADMQSPDLATLKKNEWVCTSTRTETSLVPISTGRTTTLMPVSRSVCIAYGRL